MHFSRIRPMCWALVAACGLAGVLGQDAWAQSSSLFGNSRERQPLTLPQHSWTYQAPKEPRQLRLNDLITVLVDEKSEMISEGDIDRRRRTQGSWVLKDWIIFLPGALGIRPDPQSAGDPTVSHKADGRYRASGDLETRESLKFRMTCRVVDVRPNGNLVLEGRRTIQNNNESWEVSLGGVIRPEDLLPNNTVLSEYVADLRISKREAGIVRDGYRRGWFLLWRDRFKAL